MSLRLPPRHCEALAEAIHTLAYLKDFILSLRDSVRNRGNS
ncbi:MAG: hypothetical protein SPF54_03500 [Helicobacter sp.]|nr:hypothetical protein [Helicobacter sp.]